MSIAGRAAARPGRPLFFMLATIAGWGVLRASFGTLPFAFEPCPRSPRNCRPEFLPSFPIGPLGMMPKNGHEAIGAAGLAEASFAPYLWVLH